MRVQQIITSPASADGNQWGLTDKQQDAVLAAYQKGYFDVPREQSLTKLADEFGISRQAFSGRLMRGLQSVLLHTVVVEETLTDADAD